MDKKEEDNVSKDNQVILNISETERPKQSFFAEIFDIDQVNQTVDIVAHQFDIKSLRASMNAQKDSKNKEIPPVVIAESIKIITNIEGLFRLRDSINDVCSQIEKKRGKASD